MLAYRCLDQLETVFSQERQNGIEPLLQMALGIDQAVKGGRVARGALVAAHGFASGFAFDAAKLMTNLALAVAERLRQSRIEMFQFAAHTRDGAIPPRRWRP